MLKQIFRKKVSTVASVFEIILSVFILVITAGSFINLLFKLATDISGWDYNILFDVAIELIIAVEFVKMLAKHSMGSAIEVLVFVIAKRVIIDGSHATALEVMFFVISFGILFAIRKYLHAGHNEPLGDAMVYSGKTPIEEISKLYKTEFPEALGKTVSEVVTNCLMNVGRRVGVGEKVEFKDIMIKIETMTDNNISSVEIITK